MMEMIRQRAEAQQQQMEAMVTARKEAELARLEQQRQAMNARIQHDKTLRTAQVDQTAAAAEQRRKQAELAQQMQEKVYEQMSKVGPGAGYPGFGGYGGFR